MFCVFVVAFHFVCFAIIEMCCSCYNCLFLCVDDVRARILEQIGTTLKAQTWKSIEHTTAFVCDCLDPITQRFFLFCVCSA